MHRSEFSGIEIDESGNIAVAIEREAFCPMAGAVTSCVGSDCMAFVYFPSQPNANKPTGYCGMVHK